MNEEQKHRAMNAVSHRETATQLRSLRRAPQAPGNSTGLTEVKRQAVALASDAHNVVARVGVIPVAAGLAVYAARIRQMDRAIQTQRAQSSPRKVQDVGRERLER